jgi:hypothetical protein
LEAASSLQHNPALSMLKQRDLALREQIREAPEKKFTLCFGMDDLFADALKDLYTIHNLLEASDTPLDMPVNRPWEQLAAARAASSKRK